MTDYQIVSKKTQELEELMKLLMENPSRKQELASKIIAEKKKCLDPLISCLDSLGLDKKQYVVFNTLRCAHASLTDMQVDMVRSQPYVEKINEIPDVKVIVRSDYRVEN